MKVTKLYICLVICLVYLSIPTYAQEIISPYHEVYDNPDGSKTMTIHNAPRYVYEDDMYKEVEKARSLMGVYNIIVKNDDEAHKITIVEFNMTSISLMLHYDKNKALEKYPKELKDKSLTTDFKIYEGKSLKVNKKVTIDEGELKPYILKGYPIGKEFHLGESSTVLVLQDQNTENMGDQQVKEDSESNDGAYAHIMINPKNSVEELRRGYLKFNISAIPSGQQIDIADLWMVRSYDDETSGKEGWIYAHHVYDHTWNGTTESNITWKTQPCSMDDQTIGDLGNCNGTAESYVTVDKNDGAVHKVWNVTAMVDYEYTGGNENVSIVLAHNETSCAVRERFGFYSKDHGTASQRPVLNITYSTAPLGDDDDYPTFHNETKNRANNSEYNPDFSYIFNISLVRTNGTTYLAFDGTNYTATNDTTEEFKATVGKLGVGVYNYYWGSFGNGSSNNHNRSLTYSFTIQQNSSYVLSVSGTSPIDNETAGDFEGTNCPSELTCSFQRNDTGIVSNPDTSTIATIGYYNYSYNTTGNANYTSGWASAVLQVIAAGTSTLSDSGILTDDDMLLTYNKDNGYGYVKITEEIELKQICFINGSQCDTCNITSVDYPNKTRALSNVFFTKRDNDFNYTYTKTETKGEYRVNAFCQYGTVIKPHVIYFTVTGTGYGFNQEKSLYYIALLVLLGFFLIITIYATARLPSKDPTDEWGNILSVNHLKYLKPVLILLAWGLVLAILYTASNVSLAYLDTEMFGQLLFSLYQIGFWILIAALPIMMGFIIVSVFRDNKVKRMIERGIEINSKYP